jgi:RNA polymerase sigma factor (sigma-70 family)
MPRPATPTDASLLGDRVDPGASFDRFYRRHFSALLRFIASRGLSADDAADAVAETFIAALRQRYQYRAKYPTARPWLFAIARNKIADCQRVASGERRREEALRTFDIELTGRDRGTFDALPAFVDDGSALLLEGLSSPQRAVIERRVLQDRDYAEIAAELGISEPATRLHASRGLGTLRARMNKPRRDAS